MSWGPLWSKGGLVVQKVITPKIVSRVSKGRWALSFCMEATESLKCLYQQAFGSKAQEKYFEQFNRWSTRKVGKRAKMPIVGDTYPRGTKAHIVWHMAKLKDPW